MEQLEFEFYGDGYDNLDFLHLHDAVMLEREARQHGCETLASVWQYENKLIQVN